MRKSLLLTLILLLTGWNTIVGQNSFCGTVYDAKELKDIQEQLEEFHRLKRAGINYLSLRSTKDFYIQAYIITNNDGTSGTNKGVIENGIKIANDHYAGAGLKFHLTGDPIIVKNSSFDPEKDINNYPINGAINLFCINEVYSTQANGRKEKVGGFYNGELAIAIENAGIASSVLSHEIGHLFGLMHTHGPKNHECGTEELVTRDPAKRNCETSGDQFCDTEADPNLGSKCGSLYDSKCSYIGKSKDKNGDSYKPLVNNIMSYIAADCRTDFSRDQIEFIIKRASEINLVAQSSPFFILPFNIPLVSSYDMDINVSVNTNLSSSITLEYQLKSNGKWVSIKESYPAMPGVNKIDFSVPLTIYQDQIKFKVYNALDTKQKYETNFISVLPINYNDQIESINIKPTRMHTLLVSASS
ncbi:MAG: hypothetical protein IPI11_12325 [Haliscomenobacter sp.]|nr:hypothetical protein [Haliscomenobacter sp.]